jgi:hypothetical protein
MSAEQTGRTRRSAPKVTSAAAAAAEPTVERSAGQETPNSEARPTASPRTSSVDPSSVLAPDGTRAPGPEPQTPDTETGSDTVQPAAKSGPFRLIVRTRELNWSDGLGPKDPKPTSPNESALWERRCAYQAAFDRGRAAVESVMNRENRRVNRAAAQMDYAEYRIAAQLKRRYASGLRSITNALAAQQLPPEVLDEIAALVREGKIGRGPN